MPLPRLSLGLSPAVTRSLVGIALLVLGAMTLIAFALPGGSLTDGLRNVTAPLFGAARFLFPFVLLLAGWYIEWGPGQHDGAPWGRTLGGLALSYVALLGLIQLVEFRGAFTGGSIGRFLVGLLSPAVTPVGAGIVFTGFFFLGLMFLFDAPLRTLLSPATRVAKAAGAGLQARASAATSAAGGAGAGGLGPMSTANGRSASAVPVSVADQALAAGGVRRGRSPRGGTANEVPGQTGAWGSDRPGSDIPEAVPSNVPSSATIAPLKSAQTAVPAPLDRDRDGVIESGDSPSRAKDAIAWVLPPHELLDPVDIVTKKISGNQDAAHAVVEEIIVKKLASFDIPARVVGRNAGPVVTQYEVQPAPHVKVSKIEALSDDLAMALAARSIRIEAPIPGKSAVGIEVPNADFNVVRLRRIVEEVDFNTGGTLALGQDVAGGAVAVDLAKMPHLLIAGATGSGKSVMVNALITSLLCNATPDDVRMILMDLKRVELAGYNELPHLLVPVITEPERAKAALKWAVGEMENRYRRFAGATARNIKAFNETRVDPADRMPYIVIIIDELADLMMREGKNVEDPIVRLAQKARATGIHMVLATQRPSVNVVTGLIKANFPSRIAFAMASQIDSRTILDSPGAEDLIGRGDMLYQPSDQPKAKRHQGVFVSDAEIGRITGFWKDQTDGSPRYDLSIITSDEESTGNIAEQPDEEADRLLMDAIGVIREYDRASASLLQRRLRIGYARAARIIDQLESRGYVGPIDGSTARVVLRREDPAGAADEDDA
jgi:S-DNA-T family DNA segregation ATPase FtsK/SpoIIIE